MKRRKVFVGGMHHESDTFNPILTSKDDIWVEVQTKTWTKYTRFRGFVCIPTMNERKQFNCT